MNFYPTDKGNIVFYFDSGNTVEVSGEGFEVTLEPVDLLENKPVVADFDPTKWLSKADRQCLEA